ncbi:hypothetical protein DP113_20830 [Brasilonema octagenarum UFV-E1]|jgi:hypothetical protein|uniref:Uncharacterized protein n=2 Tax=Brasilonema TaxID=383614 RepID=A0A856MIK1_9CYAN|nr:hypothetical protein [Brasilonema octagenarum UFV-OR1]QDL10020.1 hypothetical protein DP114_20905 [Brasilonema sennae CENA114]QDL16373.1 hypothetical protein DP113_20830 [Brasilonema octagenarum UFV-E1]
MLCKTSRIWILRRTYPWATLTITALRLTYLNGVKRNREKIRFLMAYFKIDFASVLSLMNDMIF